MKHRGTTSWLVLAMALLVVAGVAGVGFTWANAPSHSAGAAMHPGFVSPGSFEIAAPARLEGQSATLLADGRWLLLGGTDEEGRVLDNARFYDPKAKTYSEASALNTARSEHAAWQAPDGSMFVAGGRDAQGIPLDTVERYTLHANDLAFTDLSFLPFRLDALAVVLDDGRAFLAGGRDGEGQPLRDVLRYDVVSGTHATLSAPLSVPRINARGALLADGNVLLWGGVDDEGQPMAGGDLYDAKRHRFTAVDEKAAQEQLARLADSGRPPAVAASHPAADAVDVALDRPVALRFTHRLDPASLNGNTMNLAGPHGPVDAAITPAEGGLILFVQPRVQFLPGADYTLLVRGAKDRQGRELPFTTLSFKTRTLDAVGRGTTGSQPPVNGGDGGALTSGAIDGHVSSKEDCAASSGLLSLWERVRGWAFNQKPDQAFPSDCAITTAVIADGDRETWTPGPEHRQGNWLSGRDFAHSRDHARRIRKRLQFLANLTPRARQAVETKWKAEGFLPPGSRMAVTVKA